MAGENIGKYNVLFNVESDTSDLDNSIDSTQDKVTGLGNAFKSAAKLLGAAVIIKGITDIGKAAVKSAAQYETLVESFKVFTGNAKEASKLLKQIDDFSLKTPFEPKQLQDTAKVLLGFGRTSKEVIGDLQVLGNVAAATGSDINQLGLVFGQVAGIGKLQGQDALQFINAGIPLYQILSESLGVSVKQVKELQSEGKITFDVLNDALKKASLNGGKFAGALEAQSKTLTGLQSTLSGAFDFLLRTIGERLLPAVKETVASAITLVNTFIDFVKVPVSEKLREEQTELNLLVQKITDVNISQEQRNKLIAKLDKDYPGFLGNLSAEVVTNQQLRDRLKEVNEAYIAKIAIQRLEEDLNKVAEKQATARLKALEQESKTRKQLVNIVGEAEALRLTDNRTIKEAVDLALQEQGVTADRIKAQQEGVNVLTRRQKELLKLNQSLSQADIQQNKSNELGEEFAAIQEKIVEFQKQFNKELNLYVEVTEEAGEEDKEHEEVIESKTKKIKTLEDKIKDLAATLKKQISAGDFVGAGSTLNQIDEYAKKIGDAGDAVERFLLSARGVGGASQIGRVGSGLASNTAKSADQIKKEIDKRIGKAVTGKGAENLGRKKPLLQELLGLDDEEFELFQSRLSEASQAWGDFLQTALSMEREQVEARIALQQERVARVQEIADKGNAEQLEKEQARLEELQDKKEQIAERDRALTSLQIVAANSLAAANSISAIAGAFAPPTGNIALGIATSLALGAQIGSTILAVNSAFRDLPAFKEGDEYINGPGTGTSDSILARVSKGERITDAATNAKMGNFPNSLLPAAVATFRDLPRIKDSIMRNVASVAERETSKQLVEIKGTLESLVQINRSKGFNFHISKEGIAGIYDNNVKESLNRNALIG